jgi:MFS family permease
MHHLHFNHLPILVAAVVQWILGALWYSLFFAKPWMALTGHRKGERPKGAVLSMIGSFFGGLLLAFVVAHFVIWSGATTVCEGLFVGFVCWLGPAAVPLFFETLYERRSFKLFAINSGYWLLSMLIAGGLVAGWR